MQGIGMTDNYPFSKVSIISGNDTLSIYSEGQHPYMMPWIVDGSIVYNYLIPSIIGEMLPDNIESNKYRLRGLGFNKSLLKKIHYLHINQKIEREKAIKKYPKRFDALSKHFQIAHAELSMMGSIDWGGFIASNCLEIILKDSLISNNIQFSTVFGRRIFLHSTQSIIRNKNLILKRLEGNPVFEYCLKNDNTIGDIHFVNRKSLSNQAKRNFNQDVKKSGNSKSMYRGKFRNAIFFELTEIRGDEKSFSRWVFLLDGTIILWQFKGKFLMNLPEKHTAENGYICKEISRNEF